MPDVSFNCIYSKCVYINYSKNFSILISNTVKWAFIHWKYISFNLSKKILIQFTSVCDQLLKCNFSVVLICFPKANLKSYDILLITMA